MNKRSGRWIVTAVVMVFSTLSAFAQQDMLQEMTDMQFVDYLRQYRDPASLTVAPGVDGRAQSGKCGFAVISEAARRLENAGPAIAADILALLQPQARQTSIVSPSGKFRIYYDTSGIDEAAMLTGDSIRMPNSAHQYAQTVALVFDSVYQAEVTDIGFDPPPFEETLTKYEIFLKDFRGSLYGQTMFNLPLPSSGTVRPTYASHMEIDNDFLGYETRGLNGLRVTAAHEFHHMVQLGSYGLWMNDRWMHEMSSTYFEEAVYPQVNDYIQYIRTFMRFTSRAMWVWGADGYELVLWPIFLDQKYDRTIIRDIWVGMRQLEPMTSMRDAIQARGGDMSADLCSWANANFFTGYRSSQISPQVYGDAPSLARAQMFANMQLVGESAQTNGSLQPTGAAYIRVFRGIDTVSFVVANTSVSAAIARSPVGVNFELEVRASGWDDTFTPLGNGWAYHFSAEEANALCISVLEGGSSSAVERDLPFPNPFNPNEFSRMQFPLPRNIVENRADLYIYSVSMNLVASREGQPIELDNSFGAFVGYDARTESGNTIPSGVYFYVIKYGKESKTGKFAVIKR
ncbi:MAG: T9SS type A sorting domain-containing protein [Bacteroidota bacterium]